MTQKVKPKLELTAEVLKLKDLGSICHQIEGFIREKVLDLDKDGVVLGMSGGLDSVLVAKFCKEAVGPDRVLAIYMLHKYGNPRHGEDARRMADILGIRFKVIDLMPILEAQGIYNRFPMNLLKWLPGSLKEWTMRIGKGSIERVTGRNLFIESRRGSRDKFVAGGTAYANFIRRLQMTVLHYHADLENLLVVGAANRTEWLTGVFVKFGADGVADIMPILPLFKSQVRQLARYLELPEDIVEKPADPDLFPGFSDKEKMFGKEETLDLILFGLERGLSSLEIAASTGIDLEGIEKTRAFMESTRHMREGAYVPDLII